MGADTGQIFRNSLLLETIFRHLAPDDIKTAIGVCRHWKLTIEKPRFWTWAIMKIDKNNIEQVVSSRRLRIVPSASVEYIRESETCTASFLQFNIKLVNLLRSQVETMELKNLKISADLDDEEIKESLTEVICNVEQVDLAECDMKTNHLFVKISSYENLHLKHLLLNHIELSTVPEELLSRTLERIQSVNISNSNITLSQLNQLFRNTESKEFKLRRIDISQNRIQNLSSHSALCRLEEVNMCSMSLSTQSLDSLLSAISARDYQDLKQLDLGENNLSRVNSTSLALAAIRLEKLGLRRTKLRTEQLLDVFSHLLQAGSASRLRSLNLSLNRLTSVPPCVLSEVICQLEEANLASTRLSSEQVKALFLMISRTELLELNYLNVCDNNLSYLSLSSLRAALNRLAQVELISCKLDIQHVLSLNLRDFAQKYI